MGMAAGSPLGSDKKGARRRNGRWNEKETNLLITLVRRLGKGKWKRILEEGGNEFQNRSQVRKSRQVGERGGDGEQKRLQDWRSLRFLCDALRSARECAALCAKTAGKMAAVVSVEEFDLVALGSWKVVREQSDRAELL
jgi:hypothetical protein